MSETGLRNQILEAYCNNAEASLPEIAQKHGVPLEDCRREWRELASVGQNYASPAALGPSAITIAKILAHAREAAEADIRYAMRPSFWRLFFKPSYALATALTAITVTLMALQTMPIRFAEEVAITGSEVLQATPAGRQDSPYHVATSPLFALNNMPGLPTGAKKYNLLGDSPFASTVSYGDQSGTLALDSEIDRKVLAGALLDDKDLEVLFYRARKFERQGHFQEALRDYQFIAKFYSDYPNRKLIQLAIANCLDALEQNDKAILVLQQFENTYGATEEIDLWIDELKSVTF